MSTIDPETLAAYAEGQLGPAEAATVEAAIAADPALAQEVAAHRALKARLLAHFEPVLEAPVPDPLLALIRGAGSEGAAPAGEVVDFGAARAARDAAPRRSFLGHRWAMGGAMAASLVLGLFIGGRAPSGALVRESDGRLMAAAGLDRALSEEVSSGSAAGGVRILLSMRDSAGSYCRAFDAGTMAGIACRDDRGWVIRRADAAAAPGGEGGAYRQAGSSDAAIMAAAQDMAAGDALDAAAEKAAMEKGWR